MNTVNYERISNEEHESRFLTQDYLDNRTKTFDSRTCPDFLNEQEIELFNYYWKHPYRKHFVDTSMTPIQERVLGPGDYKTAEYNIFSDLYTNKWWAGLKEILHNRIQAWLGPDIYIPHCHVLDSHYPYGIHTDAQQAGFTFAPHPAWTVIIPLEDYNSKTYVFNEPSVQKTPEEHREAHGIELRDEMCISEEVYQQDFAGLGTPREHLQMLTVDDTFPWQAGSAIASDRYKFHSSDNYYNHGITNKRAIILWTTHT